jgi:hypothetical protein
MGKTRQSHGAEQGEVLVSAIPQWIHLLGYAAIFLIAITLRICLRQDVFDKQLNALEGHSLLMALAFVAVISLIIGPILFLNWSTRTWLRRFYPDKMAVRWNLEGFKFEGLGSVLWSEMKSVNVDIIGKANHKKMTFTLKPGTVLGGAQEIEVPLMLIRDPTNTQACLKAACDAHNLAYWPDPSLHLPASSKSSIAVSIIVIGGSITTLFLYGPGLREGLILYLFTSLVITLLVHIAGGAIWNRITGKSPKRKLKIAQKEMEAREVIYKAALLSCDKDRIAHASQNLSTSTTALIATLKEISDAYTAEIASRNDFGRNVKGIAYYSVPIALLTMYPWTENLEAVLAVVGTFFVGLIILAVSASLTTIRIDGLKTA